MKLKPIYGNVTPSKQNEPILQLPGKIHQRLDSSKLYE